MKLEVSKKEADRTCFFLLGSRRQGHLPRKMGWGTWIKVRYWVEDSCGKWESNLSKNKGSSRLHKRLSGYWKSYICTNSNLKSFWDFFFSQLPRSAGRRRKGKWMNNGEMWLHICEIIEKYIYWSLSLILDIGILKLYKVLSDKNTSSTFCSTIWSLTLVLETLVLKSFVISWVMSIYTFLSCLTVCLELIFYTSHKM